VLPSQMLLLLLRWLVGSCFCYVLVPLLRCFNHEMNVELRR
jgi:hypothetical protein